MQQISNEKLKTNMKKLLTMMTALLMAVTVKAQTPMILGENHAML